MASEMLEITEETFAGIVPALEAVANDDVESAASDGTVDLNDIEEDAADESIRTAAKQTAAVVDKDAAAREDQKPADEAPAAAVEKPVDAAVVVDEVIVAVEKEVVVDEPVVVDATPAATAKAADKPEVVAVADAATAPGSPSSSSSSSDSSSSSSSDSSDSEVEDVTHQYKKPEPTTAPRVEEDEDDEDDEAEQWFERHDLEADGIEVVGVVPSQPADDDDVDVFLLPSDNFESEIERGSATKRRRPEDAGEETCSSSDPEQSEDEYGRRRTSTAWKNHKKKGSPQPRKKPRAPAKPAASYAPPKVYTSVPEKFGVFERIAVDDSEFPILKGEYSVRGGHRAHFAGQWGFTEADFTRGVVSKFDYSSSYIHGRRDDDRRPFSGVYGGYFNLRQFNGKIMKIKEEHIEFHFLQLAGEDGQPPSEDDPMYEVFGEGKNRYGRFLVRGYFNADNGRMTVRRRYLE